VHKIYRKKAQKRHRNNREKRLIESEFSEMGGPDLSDLENGEAEF